MQRNKRQKLGRFAKGYPPAPHKKGCQCLRCGGVAPWKGKKKTMDEKQTISALQVRKSPYKNFHNRELLRKMYWDEELSFSEMAKKIGCPTGRVQKLLSKFNIPRRDPWEALPTGEKHPNWKGGRYISSTGYVYILCKEDHPRALKKGNNSHYVPEHYLVMEKHIGRELAKNETVHHLNGIKSDNRIENLMLCQSQSEHHEFEQAICLFAKRLIWGDLSPELKEKVSQLFQEFIKEK